MTALLRGLFFVGVVSSVFSAFEFKRIGWKKVFREFAVGVVGWALIVLAIDGAINGEVLPW